MRQTATAPFCRRRPPPLPAWAASPAPFSQFGLGSQEGVRACASVSSNGSASNVLPRSWLKRQTTPRPPKTRPSRRPPSAALAGPRTIAALDMGGQTITPRPVTADINKCFEIVAGTLVWRERPASHFPYRAGDRAIFNARFAGIRPAFAWRDSCQTFSWCWPHACIGQTLSALQHARFELGCHRPLARNLAVVLGSVRRLRGRPVFA